MDPEIQEIEVAIPGECAICREPLDLDDVVVSETDYPGLEVDGDPMRLVGWCSAHTPVWAIELLKADTVRSLAETNERIQQARARGKPGPFEP